MERHTNCKVIPDVSLDRPLANSESGLRFKPPALPEFVGFDEVLGFLRPNEPLRALDVGTGEGTFCTGLAEHSPGRFSHIIGVDLIGPKLGCSVVRVPPVELKYGQPYQSLLDNQFYRHFFDLVFLNCPSDKIWPECLDVIPALQRREGFVVFTGKWNMCLTPYFNAFEEPEDVRRFYLDIAQCFFHPRGYSTIVIDHDRGFPAAIENRVPGLIVARHFVDI